MWPRHAGASGNIATELIANSAPDGYAVLMGAIVAFGTAPSLFTKLPFDPVRDFAPITQTVSVNNLIVVHPVLPAKNLKALVALAKQRPGQINYATSGIGSSGHLAAELFKKTTAIASGNLTARCAVAFQAPFTRALMPCAIS